MKQRPASSSPSPHRMGRGQGEGWLLVLPFMFGEQVRLEQEATHSPSSLTPHPMGRAKRVYISMTISSLVRAILATTIWFRELAATTR